MNYIAWIPVIVSIISTGGLIIMGIKTSRTSLERTNIENAKDITAQWQALNSTLRSEMNTKFLEMQKEIDSVKQENKEIKEKFAKRELFLESEIKVRDARIVKLEIENTELKTQLAINSQEKHTL